MATATSKGFRYPEEGDPNNVPQDIQNLATDVDGMPGIATHTTTERDALAGGDLWTGRKIFNSTTARFESYNGSAWVADTSPVLDEPAMRTLSATGVSGARSYGNDNVTEYNEQLTGNVTATFSCPVATGIRYTMSILHRQDGTGGRTVTWPTVKWPGAAAPSPDTTASRANLWVFFTDDAGTTWYGTLAMRGLG